MTQIERILPYIHPAGLNEQLAVLNRTLQRGCICTIFGPMGCGKTALTDYWQEVLKTERMVRIALDPSSGEYRSVSHMIYARILEALRERHLPSYAPLLNSDNTSEAFGRRQLERLRRDLLKELKEYDPRVVIIDRIEYTDLNGIVRALTLRHRPSQDRQTKPRALILVGQKFYIKEKEQLVTWLNRLSESKEYWTERLDVEYPSWEEIAGTAKRPGILQQFFEALQVEVADDADQDTVSKQVGELVEGTQRNFASLRRLMTLFDDEAEQRPGQTLRVITKKTIARVRARLKGLVIEPEA
jgi:energy-coupling factor transporter ATP-binding protein EcfA2